MTEDEAKTKVCCGPRAAGLGEDVNCIASACMAWRWKDKAGVNEAGEPNFYPGHWQGYCGLAGSVQ